MGKSEIDLSYTINWRSHIREIAVFSVDLSSLQSLSSWADFEIIHEYRWYLLDSGSILHELQTALVRGQAGRSGHRRREEAGARRSELTCPGREKGRGVRVTKYPLRGGDLAHVTRAAARKCLQQNLSSPLIPWTEGALSSWDGGRHEPEAGPGSLPLAARFLRLEARGAGGPRRIEMPIGIIQSHCDLCYLTDGETEALARSKPKEPAVSQILE